MPQEEQVLVIERSLFEQAGAFQGLAFAVERYFSSFSARGAARFMPRSQAESDPTYKQLIPYVILGCDGKCFSYVRGKRSGEKRLTGLRSIGIGGHINPDDDGMSLFSGDFADAYRTAVQREVAEEVRVECGYTDRKVALLNDDSTQVGQVHLGIVHYWSLEAPAVTKREQLITESAFMGLDELRSVRDTMESWSQLCVDHLAEIVPKGNAHARSTLAR